MKLVLIFSVTDGYTYGFEKVLPFEYDSAEAAIVDFEAAWKASVNHPDKVFLFADELFPYSRFKYDLDGATVFDAPDILTIDEWFERELKSRRHPETFVPGRTQ